MTKWVSCDAVESHPEKFGRCADISRHARVGVGAA